MNSRGKKRHPKAQASQGDAVLIGFMGGLNHPDLATKAGEVPLPQSDDSDVDDSMDVDGREQTQEKKTAHHKTVDLVHLAENALPLLERNNGHDASKNEHSRPARPKILTRPSLPESKTSVHVKPERQCSPSAEGSSPKRAKHGSSVSRPLSRSSHSKGDADSAAISPMLRRFTIPNSERSPTETLPALQQSPPSSSIKSPKGQQNLPSLRAMQIEPLLETRNPNENAAHAIHRSSFPLTNVSVNSSPISSVGATRPNQYPSPQSRINGHFPQTYPHGQPSPAYSDASPRDSSTMSPPGKPIQSQLYTDRRTPQSEELTPQSAESHLSTSSFSTAPSPHSQHLDKDRSRLTLPPPGINGIVGTFKCDHIGCTAPAFQTQYLLNSHANVHSQNRPHYCPVPGCARSEGGRGFKRKNEMIRHGLVHESPGYICPFCPEREHKYPRPDNLQRHVRVNHMDKDTNDPRLREVLAQRCEGGTRGRRKRLGS